MSKDGIFLDSTNYVTDCCAKEAKDFQNDQMASWRLYKYLPASCEAPDVRSPNFQYDHVNLRASVGYGVADGCLVDQYSMLRNDPSQMTRDRCKIQLFERIYQGVPNLKPTVEPGSELPILQGTSTTNLEGDIYPCRKTLMEKNTYNFEQLTDSVKDIQKVEHVVEDWKRGGLPTRDYQLRKEILEQQRYNNSMLLH